MSIKETQKEWESASHSFASWIPNVSGRISYSLAGQLGSTSTRHSTEYDPGRRSRWLALEQVRQNNDFPIPSSWSAFFSKKTSQIWHLTGSTSSTTYPTTARDVENPKTNTQGVLSGSLYLFVHQADKGAKKAAKALRDDIWSSARAHDTKVIDSKIAENRLIVPKFRYALFRSGELRLWFDDQTITGILGLLEDSELEQMTQLLADQAFFFLKDMFHNHAHHRPSTDQLVPIYRTSPRTDEKDPEAIEIAWRREVLWGLTRVIKEFGRNRGLLRLKRIPGLIAYAEAFQNSQAQFQRVPGSTEKFRMIDTLHLYNFNYIETSINAQVQVIESGRSRFGQFLSFGVATVIGYASLLNTTTSAINSGKHCETCNENSSRINIEWELGVVELAVAHPFKSIVLLTFLILSAYIRVMKPFELPLLSSLQKSVSRPVYSLNITVHNILSAIISRVNSNYQLGTNLFFLTCSMSLVTIAFLSVYCAVYSVEISSVLVQLYSEYLL